MYSIQIWDSQKNEWVTFWRGICYASSADSQAKEIAASYGVKTQVKSEDVLHPVKQS